MKIKIFFTILLLHVVTFVNCTRINDDDLTSRPVNPVNQTDSKLTIATGLILSQFDLIACLYVFVRTYLRWKQNDKNSIPMSLRFPFYIASVEFFISILQTINSSSGSTIEIRNPLCSAVGLLSMFFIGFAMNLVTFITLITWYKLTRDVEFSSGPYDYILFLASSGLSIFYTLLGVGEYGHIKYWCSIQPNRKAILYMILVIVIIHLILLLAFCINARINLMKVRTNHLSFNYQDLPEENSNKIKEIEKMFSYTSAFGFQLSLIILYLIIATATQNTPIDLFRILGITIGGILIALQYIINEGWKHKAISPSQTSSSQRRVSQLSLQATISSIRDSIQRLPFTRIQVEVVQHRTTRQDIWSV